ncbi:hypothetical protein [Kitasatospora indigofera]|uniref:hypothetical protein n=1 Tax=Kitasatospora indigofera TaxID=67307 RepID=UPI0036AD567F
MPAREENWRQLALGKPFTFNLTVHLAHLRHESGQPGARAHWATQRVPDQAVSAHLLTPGQDPLFAMRRDWSKVGSRPLEELPPLTPAGKLLVDELQVAMDGQSWADGPRKRSVRALRVLVAWLGAEAPLPEEDLQSLATDTAQAHVKRLSQFLASRNLLVAAPRDDAHQLAISTVLNGLPSAIAAELRTWVTVLRGEGRWDHPPTSWERIRQYLSYLKPVVTTWSSQVTSLREVTSDDIRTVLKERKGKRAESIHVAFRSLFRALRQERVIFTDPTRGITVTATKNAPRAISSDRLMGIIDRTSGPADKLIVVLVALHALGSNDVSGLLSTSLNVSRGHLAVRRPSHFHTVYLDGLTHELAVNWLRERHRRWPVSANPHLIVSQVTAMDADGPPVHRTTINRIFQKLGLNPQQVRIDRILHEAQVTADPIHLMRLFGISAATAMKYVRAAHPERTAGLPR